MDATEGRDVEIAVSKYNSFVDRPDGVMGYNARTGVFALLADEVAGALRSGAVPSNPNVTDELVDLGFLHRKSEIDELIELYSSQAGTGEALSLTLVPSLGCNKACPYCYQDEYRTEHKMSAEVQDAVIDYVRRKSEAKGVHTLDVIWYGGEPLLAKEIVLSLSRRLHALGKEVGFAVPPMKIVSNGLLLSVDVAQELVSVGITAVQVSFDALVETGRTTRGVVAPNGRFSKILENVCAIQDLMSVNVRINVGNANRGDVPLMREHIRGAGFRGQINLARISDYEGEAGCRVDKFGQRNRVGQRTEATAQVIEDQDTLRRREFADFERVMMRDTPGAIDYMAKRLTPKKHFCGATTGNFIVIDSSGDLSRCWLSAGSASERIGNVVDICMDLASLSVEDARWAAASPFRFRECLSCKALPLCMGGCSHSRVFMDAKRPPCESIKFQLDAFVKEIGSHLAVD